MHRYRLNAHHEATAVKREVQGASFHKGAELLIVVKKQEGKRNKKKHYEVYLTINLYSKYKWNILLLFLYFYIK